MRIKIGRVHIAVAHRGQGLHTEEKGAQKARRRLVGNGLVGEQVEPGEYGVESHKGKGAHRHEPGPTQHHGVVVNVLQMRTRQTMGVHLG